MHALTAEVTSLCRFRELGDAMSGQMEEGKSYTRCLECLAEALVSSHTFGSVDGLFCLAEAILRPACLLVQSVSPDYEAGTCSVCPAM